MKTVNIDDLNILYYALSDVIGFITDNSCGDPDCCGGPFYDDEQYEDGLKVLANFGLKFHHD